MQARQENCKEYLQGVELPLNSMPLNNLPLNSMPLNNLPLNSMPAASFGKPRNLATLAMGCAGYGIGIRPMAAAWAKLCCNAGS